LESSSLLSVGPNRADHLGTVDLHLGPHPATVHFARANHRDLFLHQLNQPNTAIGLAFGGKRPLRWEVAFAGQPAIVICHQFHNGIIPLPQPRFKPSIQVLGGVLKTRFDTLRRQHESEAAGTARKSLADPNAYDLFALNDPRRKTLIRFWEAWQDSPARGSPPGASGRYTYEPRDDVHPMPDYENALTD
jgi:hypothetical protein